MQQRKVSYDEFVAKLTELGVKLTGRLAETVAEPGRVQQYLLVLPGTKLPVAQGGQRFGSGGYSAVYRIHGPITVNVNSVADEFIYGKHGVAIVDAPGAVVRCYEGDAIGHEGRTFKDYIALCVAELAA